MRRLLLPFLLLAVALVGCTPTVDLTVRYLPASSSVVANSDRPTVTGAPPPSHVTGHPLGTVITDRFSYLAGTSGTVTIASGYYVTGVGVHATAAATMTIAPSNSDTSSPTTGPTITIPASSSWSIPMSIMRPLDLGGGTVFVFTGTDAYVITLQNGGG